MNGGSATRRGVAGSALLWLLLIINSVLGFMVVTFSADLARVRREAVTQQDLEAVRDQASALEQSVLAAGRKDGAQVRNVADIQADLERLERAVFGLGGSSLQQDDAIGELQSAIDELERSVSSLRSCVNGLGSAFSSGYIFC